MAPDSPPPDEIRAALEQIVASPQLASCPSLCRFLRYVVGESLAGRGGQIKEYCLGVEVFDRGDDFDPCIDPIVRVQARNLRARMARYYDGPGANEPVRIDLPKRTYVPVFTARAQDGFVSPPEKRRKGALRGRDFQQLIGPLPSAG